MTTIILAAGLSARMGVNKLLLKYNGLTIIENTLKSVLKVSDRTLIVVGNDSDKIKTLLGKYNVEFVDNENYRLGQRSSTLKGVEKVFDDDFAIIPGDLPLIKEQDLNGTFLLLERYKIARAFYGSTPGHPVAYRKENRERLLSFPGTMKEYLKTTNVGIYTGSIGTVFDIDSPNRYQELLSGDFNLATRE